MSSATQTSKDVESGADDLRRAIERLTRQVASLRDDLYRASADFPEKLRRYRRSRLDAIAGGDAPVALEDGPRLILHVLPHTAFEAVPPKLDLSKANMMIFGSGGNPTYNADGRLMWPDRGVNRQWGYAHLTRSGCIEATRQLDVQGSPAAILVVPLEVEIVRACSDYLDTLTKLGVSGLVDVAITILESKAQIMAHGWHDSNRHCRVPILRNEVMLEPVQIPARAMSYDETATAMRPALDALWQTGGWERSHSFDPQGGWHPR